MVRCFSSSEFIKLSNLSLSLDHGMYVSLEIKAHLSLKETLLCTTYSSYHVLLKGPAPGKPQVSADSAQGKSENVCAICTKLRV